MNFNDIEKLFSLILQGNNSLTPSETSPGAPGEALFNMPTIHGAGLG